MDGCGNVFFFDNARGTVRRLDARGGTLSTVAGNGTQQYSGDGGSALAAGLEPGRLAADSEGNVFVTGQGRVRRIDARTGRIATYAGTGVSGTTGDGGPATKADIVVQGIALDPQGNLYLTGNGWLRWVEATTGVIRTILRPAAAAAAGSSWSFESIAVDAAGTVYFATPSPLTFRAVERATGQARTLSTPGRIGWQYSSVLAARSLQVTDEGLLVYVATLNTQVSSNRWASSTAVVALDLVSGTHTILAGKGVSYGCCYTDTYSGDGGPAAGAGLGAVDSIVVDDAENVYISATPRRIPLRPRSSRQASRAERLTSGRSSPRSIPGARTPPPRESPVRSFRTTSSVGLLGRRILATSLYHTPASGPGDAAPGLTPGDSSGDSSSRSQPFSLSAFRFSRQGLELLLSRLLVERPDLLGGERR